MIPRSLEPDPLWYKDAIIYEVHVKSFFDGNNDGIGDFPGLIQKLDYLQDLGITAIWLLPFYPSPLRDDGYDIADYRGIHPSYGTLRDFKQFVREAHRRGMRVITELVINHTSDQHAWFQASRLAPPGSSKRDYYVWSDTDQRYRDARVIFTDSEKSNWTWDPVARQYYWHRFFGHQPDLNFQNPRLRRAIFNILRFWLDMDVDGMRLDAVPYLCEQDGTSCENLAETHGVLKELRRELDANYPNRMFLSEANQWPLDVLPYFGNSDECHMSFHFPLMPRIFMALRQEDRHPITEIMEQTPDIPNDCQWALFLRNHDELTLEMVTKEERDYMYKEYAADPRARLNLGIRRRLAPLVDFNRRQIELLTMLLFSFPGTPVLYYGDEIGMGDNIYLGDRNGVRTPMQWNGDRNGGFSRADFARLYCSPIMDPVCGYQAVNVEAQEREPSSLLSWTRRMIALRKRSQTFGRGTIDFLRPANRKVLAYVRQYQDEVILCVANLSRFVQPVDLDLSAFAGLLPVETLGRVEFPTINEQPYFLSVGPYACHWFQLQKVATPITVSTAPVAETTLALPNLSIGSKWESVLENHPRKLLEREMLPAFLRRQRWFGGKAKGIKATRLADWSVLKNPNLALACLAVVEVDFADGSNDRYLMPLGVTPIREPAGQLAITANAVLARLNGPEGEGLLHDAMVDDSFCQQLVGAIEGNLKLTTRAGGILGCPTSAFAAIRGPAETPLNVERSTAGSSNTCVKIGNRMLLKLIRRLQTGTNPEVEIGRYLTEQGNFPRAPRMAGTIEYNQTGSEAISLATVQELVKNEGDGWDHTLADLGRFLERAAAAPPETLPIEPHLESLAEVLRTDTDPPAMLEETIGTYLHEADTLGKRTAELHLALAANTQDSAFCPEPLTADDLSLLSKSLREEAWQALTALDQQLHRLPESSSEQAHWLLSQRSRIFKRISEVATMHFDVCKTRCHGDYHLGQVLWSESDFVIIDFEGEPARSLAERRAKQSPLKDVAGMLRSFHYVAHAGLFAFTQDHPEECRKWEPWIRAWQTWVSARFLKSYLATAHGAVFLPHEINEFFALLDCFVLDKALYELLYELNNRPDWVRIPLRGILQLFEQESIHEPTLSF